jgi:hypothetical protein
MALAITIDGQGRFVEAEVGVEGESGGDQHRVSALNDTGVTIAANKAVNLYDESSSLGMRLASMVVSPPFRVMGFTVTSVSDDTNGDVQTYGPLDGFSTLTIGARYYANPASPGGITSSIPTTAGQWAQYVGWAMSTTKLFIELGIPLKRA